MARLLDCIATFVTVFSVSACVGSGDRSAALVPHGEPEVAVMDFSRPPTLDPLPAGWYHRKFWTRAPLEMSLGVKDGVPAIRLATNGSASMLMRVVDVDLRQYPRLAWRWPDAAPARVTDIGLFCDSDDTRTSSIAWFADLRLRQAR